MFETVCSRQLNLFSVGKQQVTVDFRGGNIVCDAGLLPLAQLVDGLGILDDLADRFPDPRKQEGVVHPVRQVLGQQIYQFLAGYFDFDDANVTRQNPLFQTLVGVSPSDQQPLASGSTIARFHHAYTRREADKPLEDREVIFEQRQAQVDRIRLTNEYLVELFAKTRTETPTHVILDLDGSEDAAYGQQQLTFWNAHYDQNQYFPLFVLDGASGFPLAAWLRPGNVHDGCGAVETLQQVVRLLRRYFPDLSIFVRGDGSFSGPEMLDFCEREGLFYAFGYSNHRGLKPQTGFILEQLQLYHRFYPEPDVQRFDDLRYQAGSWSHPRRLILKTEMNFIGSNQRLIVSNLSGSAQGIYQGFYVQRGNIPERPIGELKNGLGSDRLSSSRFLANSQKLLSHVVAYAIVVLFREACRTAAAGLPSEAEVPEAVLAHPAAEPVQARLEPQAVWSEAASESPAEPVTVQVGGPSVVVARVDTATVSLGGWHEPVEEPPYAPSSDVRQLQPCDSSSPESEAVCGKSVSVADSPIPVAATPPELLPPPLTSAEVAALTANRQMLLEVSKWEVSTLRERLFKVGALVKTSVRRIWFHLSSHWPHQELYGLVHESIQQFVLRLQGRPAMTTGPPG
jgi:hypothetical protein